VAVASSDSQSVSICTGADSKLGLGYRDKADLEAPNIPSSLRDADAAGLLMPMT